MVALFQPIAAAASSMLKYSWFPTGSFMHSSSLTVMLSGSDFLSTHITERSHLSRMYHKHSIAVNSSRQNLDNYRLHVLLSRGDTTLISLKPQRVAILERNDVPDYHTRYPYSMSESKLLCSNQ